jgi:hypothetical protein
MPAFFKQDSKSVNPGLTFETEKVVKRQNRSFETKFKTYGTK